MSFEEEEEPTGSGDQDGPGSDLNARLTLWWSYPLVRFAVRAAIPIVLVIVVAVIVGSH